MNALSNWHIIAYDITDKKNLNKVHRQLQKVAMPIQKSVFLIHATDTQLQAILNQISTIINKKQDDIRSYPVESAQSIWFSGKSTTPCLFMDSPIQKHTWNHTQQPILSI